MTDACKPIWDRHIGAHGDDEQARSRLRHEQRRVDHQRAETIILRGQRPANRFEVFAAMRGQRAADIFEHDRRRRTALAPQRRHQRPERPEAARAFALQPRTDACERQILTGKGRPDEIGAAGQLRGRDRRDIADMQRFPAPVPAVGLGFLRVEIIGEKAGPAGVRARPAPCPRLRRIRKNPVCRSCPDSR